jgi:uncharacterized protein DUF4402
VLRLRKNDCLPLLVSFLTIASSGALAASHTATGTASMTVLRSIAVTKTADLSFGRFQNQAGKTSGTVTVTSAPPASVTSNGVILVSGNSNPSPAIFSITGEPNRAYVASVPSGVTSTPGGFPLSAFTFWSQNSGTLAGGAGHFSAGGSDTLRVGATVSVPAKTPINTYGAIVPVTISYQ